MSLIFDKLSVNPEIVLISKEFVVIVACLASNVGCNPETKDIGIELVVRLFCFESIIA